ncbi:thioredoxin family protein [uncultured Thermanaerothrix sp.]|uniref:thioredoxin family protein n=1 Tax=uncultured Thermanaerothrix sp. TaxID=1195149 RepID=UPI0026371896|nr:thioredoxin family protein [uncultured Thermanaerothrix sp.]
MTPETEILTRLLWALLILGAGGMAFALINRWLLWRAGRSQTSPPGFRPGRPAILYFTTPECVPCKTLQRPALQRVRERLGEALQIIEINAYEYPQLANQWGVFSIPTTFILDAKGHPHFVNRGVARAEQLLAQIAQVHQGRAEGLPGETA